MGNDPLGQKRYTSKIDIWSIGCIFAELLGRCTLFKGRDELDQLYKIINIVGTPSQEDQQFIVKKRFKEHLKTLPVRKGVPLKDLYTKASPEALDLLENMIKFNPAKRYQVE